MTAGAGTEQETFNPWTVVNIVFHHLADAGLHPVLGGQGDPAAAATDLLAAMGIAAAHDKAGPADPEIRDELTELRRTLMPGIE
ncbi:hypothetical protein [Pseudonocardia phyllosphaerae]|uniref:hypothetical protein n=1 Tax=Pseudonocardia phyllosphaerae TaxID=3390502 RepID=UPI00397CD038